MDYWLSCGDIASTLGHQQPRYHISIMHCRRTNHQIWNGEKWGPLCHREPKQIHSHDSNLISQPKKWVIIFHSSKKKEADVRIFRCFVHKRHYDEFTMNKYCRIRCCDSGWLWLYRGYIMPNSLFQCFGTSIWVSGVSTNPLIVKNVNPVISLWAPWVWKHNSRCSIWTFSSFLRKKEDKEEQPSSEES